MGRPKHALQLPDGRTFLHAVAESLEAVCDGVLIVIAADGDDAEFSEFDVTRDQRRGGGPLAGIEAALARSGAGGDPWLICTCDQPLVTAQTLERLARAAAPAIFDSAGDQASFFPMLLHAEHLAVVQALLDREERRVSAFIEALRPARVGLLNSERQMLRNFNTQDDLRAL